MVPEKLCGKYTTKKQSQAWQEVAMSNDSGFTGLIIAKIICCGGLVLLAGTGVLAGLGGWLSDNAWLVAAAVGFGVAALVLYLRSRAPAKADDSPPAPPKVDWK